MLLAAGRLGPHLKNEIFPMRSDKQKTASLLHPGINAPGTEHFAVLIYK
jgi:hypothetical protein